MGFSWSAFGHYAEIFAPLVLAETPLAPLAPFAGKGIQVAEAAAQHSPLSGPQKLAVATTEIQNSIAAANAQAGRQVIDPALANEALAMGISAVVDVINIKQGIAAPKDPQAGRG